MARCQSQQARWPVTPSTSRVGARVWPPKPGQASRGTARDGAPRGQSNAGRPAVPVAFSAASASSVHSVIDFPLASATGTSIYIVSRSANGHLTDQSIWTATSDTPGSQPPGGRDHRFLSGDCGANIVAWQRFDCRGGRDDSLVISCEGPQRCRLAALASDGSSCRW